MDPTMYIVINRGLGMSPGKIAAQAAHAAVEAYRITPQDSNLMRLWYRSGHYKKIVLEGRDEAHMRNAHYYLSNRGVSNVEIIDEGHTEVKPLSLTAIGCELVDKDDPHISGIFKTFNLYLEPKPFTFNPEKVPYSYSWESPFSRNSKWVTFVGFPYKTTKEK